MKGPEAPAQACRGCPPTQTIVLENAVKYPEHPLRLTLLLTVGSSLAAASCLRATLAAEQALQ